MGDKDKEENENKTTNESQPEPAKDEKISQEESAVTAETTAESRPEQVDITDLENVNSKKMKKNERNNCKKKRDKLLQVTIQFKSQNPKNGNLTKTMKIPVEKNPGQNRKTIKAMQRNNR